MANKYMHLMNGEPAYYFKTGRLFFARSGISASDLLVDSLKKLRGQQARDAALCESLGIRRKYDYLRIKVD